MGGIGATDKHSRVLCIEIVFKDKNVNKLIEARSAEQKEVQKLSLGTENI